VRTRVESWALSAVMTMLSAGPALAADDVSVLKDLTADYFASCQDGNRYRVFVNPEGRVVALKQ
jgi:hypothetical protein